MDFYAFLPQRYFKHPFGKFRMLRHSLALYSYHFWPEQLFRIEDPQVVFARKKSW